MLIEYDNTPPPEKPLLPQNSNTLKYIPFLKLGVQLRITKQHVFILASTS